jgi:oxygen-dependent protoporphyrinogen oxidase
MDQRVEDITHVPLLILGGGISGMGAAFKAQEQGQEFLLLEAAPQLGGCLSSVEVGGHTLDIGANSCASSENFEQFLIHLGLKDKVLKASNNSKKRFLFHDEKVVSVSGLNDIFSASWLSFGAKLRFACEPFQKKGTTLDESIASFLSRRIGRKTTEKLVDPVLGGIYAGDINYLSADTVLEKFKRGEQENGSLFRTLLKDPPKSRKIINLKGGFATIGKAFKEKYESQILVKTLVQGIEITGSGYFIRTKNGNYSCEKLVSTLPTYVLADLLKGELQNHLEQLKYETLSVSHFSEKYREQNLDGFGILVPSSSKMKIKGVLFTSSIFQGRAPEGMRNMTVFHKASDLESIQKELNKILDHHPRQLLHSYDWKQAIPQPHVGFSQWKSELLEKLPENMHLAGNYLGKVGVADAFYSGYDLKI